jgi:hypothetical protein
MDSEYRLNTSPRQPGLVMDLKMLNVKQQLQKISNSLHKISCEVTTYDSVAQKVGAVIQKLVTTCMPGTHFKLINASQRSDEKV